MKKTSPLRTCHEEDIEAHPHPAPQVDCRPEREEVVRVLQQQLRAHSFHVAHDQRHDWLDQEDQHGPLHANQLMPMFHYTQGKQFDEYC